MSPQEFILTIIIIGITCIISFMAFSNEKLLNDLIFYPPAVSKHNQFYRFITCGFIHADVLHLLFNMYAMYAFGRVIEVYFGQIFGDSGRLMYAVLYLTSLVVSLLPTYFKHKDDGYYRSLGASGAVSAVVFAFIFLDPTARVGLIFLPIPAPAFVFGAVYLIVTALLDKRGGGNINHSAHLFGALYGIVFVIIATKFMSDYDALEGFIQKVKYYIATF